MHYSLQLFSHLTACCTYDIISWMLYHVQLQRAEPDIVLTLMVCYRLVGEAAVNSHMSM